MLAYMAITRANTADCIEPLRNVLNQLDRQHTEWHVASGICAGDGCGTCKAIGHLSIEIDALLEVI